MQRNDHKKRELILWLFVVAVAATIIPLFINPPSNSEIIYFQILFSVINLAPVIVIIFIVKSKQGDSKKMIWHLNAQITATALFILSHVSFNLGMVYMLSEREQGFSTSAIAYLLLPIISVLVVVVGYLVGYFVSRVQSTK